MRTISEKDSVSVSVWEEGICFSLFTGLVFARKGLRPTSSSHYWFGIENLINEKENVCVGVSSMWKQNSSHSFVMADWSGIVNASSLIQFEKDIKRIVVASVAVELRAAFFRNW